MSKNTHKADHLLNIHRSVDSFCQMLWLRATRSLHCVAPHLKRKRSKELNFVCRAQALITHYSSLTYRLFWWRISDPEASGEPMTTHRLFWWRISESNR